MIKRSSMKIFGIFCLSIHLVFVVGLVGAGSSPENDRENSLNSFLTQYFGHHSFKLIKNGMDIGGTKMYLAVRYVNSKDSGKLIFRKGIAVEIEEKTIVPLLYFENNLILGKDRKILVDLRPHHHKCYGWLFNTPRKKSEEIYHNGFSINVAWVFDENHLNTAQDPPISIKWDENKKEFFDHVFHGE